MSNGHTRTRNKNNINNTEYTCTLRTSNAPHHAENFIFLKKKKKNNKTTNTKTKRGDTKCTNVYNLIGFGARVEPHGSCIMDIY